MYNNVFIVTCLINMVKVLSACSDNVEGKLWCSEIALLVSLACERPGF